MPARKPVALLKLTGSYRPRRHSKRTRGPLTEGPVEKPEFADPVAAAAWDRLIAPLVLVGVVAALDVPAAQACCECWALYRKCLALLTADPTDKLARTAASNYLTLYTKLASKFGLNPLDRERIEIPAPSTDDPIEKFLDHAPRRVRSKSDYFVK